MPSLPKSSTRFAAPLYFPLSLDLLADGAHWFATLFPDNDNVVFFDKDETLVSIRDRKRVPHTCLINGVVRQLRAHSRKPLLVLYTLSSRSDLEADLLRFPELQDLFDVCITSENFDEARMREFVRTGKLTGDPLKLEWERMLKPVGRIVCRPGVVLVDDCVDSAWSTARTGIDGVKAYRIEDDTQENAKRVWAEIVNFFV